MYKEEYKGDNDTCNNCNHKVKNDREQEGGHENDDVTNLTGLADAKEALPFAHVVSNEEKYCGNNRHGNKLCHGHHDHKEQQNNDSV